MSDQISDRRAKLDKIRALGFDPYGGRFPSVTPNGEIREVGERLNIEAGQICELDAARFRAAGRVVLYRDIGSLIFMTVRDRTGELQFGLSKKMLAGPVEAVSRSAGGVGSAASSGAAGSGPDAAAAWKLAKLLDLGDIVGVDGRLGRTKTGELTLWADRFGLLSKAVRPPPEKWHGLADIELRYRRRYVDLFANPESQRVFLLRAAILQHVRDVLHRRGFVEVETPVLQPIYGGAAARPFTTHHNTLGMDLYLRISPELYLKRLLVGGLERVYELARCFRNEGISPRHNPEFTMLELYQAYGDYHDMMDITEEVVAGAARRVLGDYRVGHGAPDAEGMRPEVIDFTPPWPRRRYADLLREYAGVDLHDAAAVLRKAREIGLLARLEKAAAAAARGADPAKVGPPGMEQLPNPSVPPGQIDPVLVANALFEDLVEPHLRGPTFVIDYPAPLCPLTRRDPADPRIALRFEAYVHGMEIGNAYSELNDPEMQRANLAAQVAGEGEETMRVMDEDFVEALEHGMPPAGGLGIGIDRLVMLLTGSASIRDVLLFPLQRPQATP